MLLSAGGSTLDLSRARSTLREEGVHSIPRRLPGLALALLVCGSAIGLPPKPVEDPAIDGKKLSAWVADLRDKDVAVRRAATAVMEKLPAALRGAELIHESRELLSRALVAALDDKDATVRFNAVTSLTLLVSGTTLMSAGKTKPSDREKALAILLEGMRSPDAKVRARAATTLPKVEPKEQAALAPLIRLLKDPDQAVRASAAGALGGIEPRRSAVPALVGALDDEAPAVRNASAGALGVMGRDAEAAVPRLIAALKDSDGRVSSNAATALARVGPAAKAALPGLLDMWNTKDGGDRRRALSALVAIDPDGDKTQAVIVAALRSNDGGVQLAATSHCYRRGAKAKFAVPALLDLLKHEDEYSRETAAHTLKRVDPEAAKKAGVR
jgi:HEAT repeat protein